MRIRKLERIDVPFVQKLLIDNAPHTIPRFSDEILASNFIVAEEESQIIGCCSFEDYSEKLGEVRSVAVLPSYQRKGIGKKLVDTAIDWFGHQNQEIIVVTDSPSYFKKLGFNSTLNNKVVLIKVKGGN